MIILKDRYDNEEQAAAAARQAEQLGNIVVAWRKASDGKWELVKF